MLVIIARSVWLPQRWTLIKPFVVSSCSWFVFPSLSQSLGRGQVWDFLQCSALIITFMWEGRHLLKDSHCSSTYVNRKTSMPGAARVGVWQECLSLGSSQPSQASRKWRRNRRKVAVQVTCRARVWGRQLQFPRTWLTGRTARLWSLAKANQPLNTSKKWFCGNPKKTPPCFQAIELLSLLLKIAASIKIKLLFRNDELNSLVLRPLKQNIWTSEMPTSSPHLFDLSKSFSS